MNDYYIYFAYFHSFLGYCIFIHKSLFKDLTYLTDCSSSDCAKIVLSEYLFVCEYFFCIKTPFYFVQINKIIKFF